MKTQTDLSSMWARSTTRRFLLWLSSWRVVRGILFTLAVLVTLVALAYTIENVRGKRAWERYRRDLEARGEKLDLRAFVPPPLPDDQNFAMTPFLAPLFDFVASPKPGESPWRDTNGHARATQFTKDWPSQVETLGWREGKKIDLTEWFAALEEKRSRPAKSGTDPTVAPGRHDPMTAAAAVLEALRPHEPILDELRAASRRPHARFNLRYDQENPYAILLPHLAVIKGICQALKIRALAELALGEATKAFDDVQLMLYLADSVKDEPLLISYLVRLANFQIALQPVWEGLADRRWSEAQLAHLQARLRQFSLLEDLQDALRGERAFGIKLAELVRQARDRASLVDSLGSGPTEPTQRSLEALLWNLIPRGVFYFETLNYARLFDGTFLSDNVTPTNRVHPGRVHQNDQRLSAALHPRGRAIWNHYVLSGMLLPALRKVFPKAAYAQTAADEAEVACALERYHLAHGSYPEQLEALAPRFIQTLPPDVITGKPLTYRCTENGRYVLYSVGWNETDDGGIRPGGFSEGDRLQAPQLQPKKSSGSRKSSFNLENGDWVWRYPED